MKWNLKLKDQKTIEIKALKAEAEYFTRKIKEALELKGYHKDLTGTLEKPETWHETILWSPFGGLQAPMSDPEGYQKARQELIDSIPLSIIKENFEPILKKAKEIFDIFIPVKDSRETLDQIGERNKATQAHIDANEAKAREFRNQFCQPNPVNIPPGSMAVYLEITFDDSDTQTDYFHPHAQIGQDMLLAIVPKQHETERLCRSILDRYPELSKLIWTWKTENYSMGHGNYLISEYPEGLIFQKKAYDHREEVHARYEIRCNAYTQEIHPYKDYPGTMPAISEAPINSNGNVTITHNAEHNGIEVRFPTKPDQEILDYLKNQGFRWSRFQKIWYARYSESKFQEVTQKFTV